jgi:hypothetical protein
MRDIEAAVANATHELVKSGRLTEIIKTQVESTVERILKDALGEWSPSGKQLKEAVESALSIDPERLGLPGYNQTVLTIVRNALDARVEEVAGKKLKADLDQMLGTAAPKEIKLSALVKEFKKFARDRGGHEEGEKAVTVILERDRGYSSRWLYLDVDPCKEKYRCAFQMLLSNDGDVHVCKIDGHDPKKSIFLGVLTGFDRLIFQMYAAGTKVVIDQEEFDDELED